MKNILTIDLEDWYQLTYFQFTGNLLPPGDSIFRQLDCLLNLLNEYKTKATFFVLGLVAEDHPDLIKSIVAQGHEIASHGYAHITINRLSRNQFREDTKRAKGLLEGITGLPVYGYRAAEFSIRKQTLWALRILADLEFVYDSSIFPIHHRRYGIADFYPKAMRYDLGSGSQIIEIPPATVSFGKLKLPVAGGGYFRLMPLWMIRRVFERLNGYQIPLMTYCHPYEFDSQHLNIFELLDPSDWKECVKGLRVNFQQNLRRQTMTTKISGLLREFKFTTCQDFLEERNINESRNLFSKDGQRV